MAPKKNEPRIEVITTTSSIPDEIVDTLFVKRGRYGRLLQAITA